MLVSTYPVMKFGPVVGKMDGQVTLFWIFSNMDLMFKRFADKIVQIWSLCASVTASRTALNSSIVVEVKVKVVSSLFISAGSISVCLLNLFLYLLMISISASSRYSSLCTISRALAYVSCRPLMIWLQDLNKQLFCRLFVSCSWEAARSCCVAVSCCCKVSTISWSSSSVGCGFGWLVCGIGSWKVGCCGKFGCCGKLVSGGKNVGCWGKFTGCWKPFWLFWNPLGVCIGLTSNNGIFESSKSCLVASSCSSGVWFCWNVNLVFWNCISGFTDGFFVMKVLIGGWMSGVRYSLRSEKNRALVVN